jgi:hypothetical protein
MRHYLAIAAALAIAACSGGEKKADAVATGSPVAAAAPTAAPPTPALADVDMVQAGKWAMTISTMGQSLPTSEICIEKTMTYAEAQEKQKKAGVTCSENSYHREGDKLIGHSVCTMKGMAGAGEMKMTSDLVLTGDLKTAYTVEQSVKMDPAPAGMGEMKSTVVAKRIGDCEPAK